MISLSLLFLQAAAAGQTAAPTPVIDAGRFAGHIRTLASDGFEGRGPGTAGEERSIAYIAAQFRAAGLRPGGGDGGWFQAVRALRTTVTGTPEGAWSVNGAAEPLVYRTDFIPYSRRAGGRVAIAHAPLVFVGYGIEAPDRGWDDYKGVDLHGAIAVVLVNEPDRTDPAGPFDGPALTAHGLIRSKAEALARHGAAGAIFIHDAAGVGWEWRVAQTSFTQPQFGLEDGPAAPAFEAWLEAGAAARQVRAGDRDLAALTAAAGRRDFRPVRLDGTLSLAFYYRADRIVSRNVVAILPGRSRPDEFVLYSAHWDHLGRTDAGPGEDGIYNGAMDNATGVAAIVEIGRALAAGRRPERSIIFLATTLEEKGLLGARYYAAHPLYPLERTAAAINVDALMPFPPARDLTIVGPGKSDLDAVFAAEAAAHGRRLTPDGNPEFGAYYRSDHFPFAERGVPSAFLSSGSDLLVGSEAAAAPLIARIGTIYHQPSDEYGADFRVDGMIPDVRLFAAVGLAIADSRAWPRWTAGSEFAPIRARSEEARRR